MLIELENSKFKATVDLISIDRSSNDIDYKLIQLEETADLDIIEEEITEVLYGELETRGMI